MTNHGIRIGGAWLAVAAVLLVIACGDDSATTNDNDNDNGNLNQVGTCGDGDLTGVEECDDGQDNSDTVPDACRADCSLPSCGDGVTDPSHAEECDDGSANSDSEPDTCRTDCSAPYCGDGVIDSLAGELCDNGADNSDGPDATCRTSCLPGGCGDGILDMGSGETCDDGNTVDGDGCDAGCTVEPWFECSGAPSVCACVDYHRGPDCATCSVLVTPGGGAPQDGLTWATAHASVQAAINAAADLTEDCQVWVAEGTYYVYHFHVTETISLAAGVEVYGGFAGTETALADRDFVAHETILDGGNSGSGSEHVMQVLSGADDSRLDGFTITGGDAGVYNDGSSPTLANCLFLGSDTHDSVGVHSQSAAHPYIVNCVFTGHTRNSAAMPGSALFNNGANPTLESCLFYDNVAYQGGAMGNWSSSPLIINCTFADNGATAASDGGGAIYNSNSSPQIFNTIIWGNAPSGIFSANGGQMTRYNNVMQDTDYSVNNNIHDNPLFVSPSAGDYTLAAGSPCIDNADQLNQLHAPATDLVGQARVDGDNDGTVTPDMGAYEYVP